MQSLGKVNGRSKPAVSTPYKVATSSLAAGNLGTNSGVDYSSPVHTRSRAGGKKALEGVEV